MAIYSIGEALIDFMPEGEGFLPAVGGAPANVAACVARLNGSAYFIGKVGDDLFGKKIIFALQQSGVNLCYLSATKQANTALAFVELQKNGEREFSFYRNPSADMFLTIADVEKIKFSSDDILHFCSVDLLDMPIKYATAKAIENCRAAGGTVSFDPNVRLSLWEDRDAYRKVILEFIDKADIVKLAEDECDFIFGNKSIDDIVEELLSKAKQLIITRGARGSKLYTAGGFIEAAPFSVKCVDTTGAGDTFIGTYLRYYREIGCQTALLRASAAAAIVCTKKGVLGSLPDETALSEFIGGRR